MPTKRLLLNSVLALVFIATTPHAIAQRGNSSYRRNIDDLLKSYPNPKLQSGYWLTFEELGHLDAIDPRLIFPILLTQFTPKPEDSSKIVELTSRLLEGRFDRDFSGLINEKLSEKARAYEDTARHVRANPLLVEALEDNRPRIVILLRKALLGDQSAVATGIRLGELCNADAYFRSIRSFADEVLTVANTLDMYSNSRFNYPSDLSTLLFEASHVLTSNSLPVAQEKAREALARLQRDAKMRAQVREEVDKSFEERKKSCRQQKYFFCEELGEKGQCVNQSYYTREECD